MMLPIKVGHAYDVHRLVSGEYLILGGIKVPCEFSFDAHSDGDVVFHAVSEALLGALGKGDLGTHFPDNDDRYLNYPSSNIFLYCLDLVEKAGYVIGNIDCSIYLEKPKIAKYIQHIKNNLANIAKISPSQVNIKACTNEKLGEIGSSLAGAASAVVTLFNKDTIG